MNFRITHIDFRTLTLVLGVCLIFIVYQMYRGSFQMYELGSDQQYIGVMVLKQNHPELFSRDYVFGDMSLLRFYTPSYLSLIQRLTRLSGSYPGALLYLLPFVAIVYLSGAFVLLFSLTKNIWGAALVALVSALQWPALFGEVWGAAELQLMIPRTLFTALAPWLFYLFFRWLASGDWWRWPLLAFLGGIAANLHPVSGLGFIQLLLSMLLLTYRFTWRSLILVIISGLTALLGAWPTVSNFVGAISSHTTTPVLFTTYYQVLSERINTIFFGDVTLFNLLGHNLNVLERQIVGWVYLVGMLICLSALFLVRPDRTIPQIRSWLYAILLFLQLPLVDILTMGAGTTILVVVTFGWLSRNLLVEPDQVDRWNLTLLSLIVSYAYLGSYFLNLIWTRFELWQFTTLILEQPRINRFVYVPLFILLARFLQRTLEIFPPKRGILLVGSVICLIVLVPNRHSLIWGGIVGLIVFGWRYGLPWFKVNRWLRLGYEVVFWTLIVRIIFFVLMAPIHYAGLLAFTLSIAYSLSNFLRRNYQLSWPRVALAGGLTLVLTVVLVRSIYVGSVFTLWKTEFVSASVRIWTGVFPQDSRQISPDRRDSFAFYSWARFSTAVDSLFYYNDFEFRLWAQRSLTHSWKDLGTAYYHGGQVIDFYDRYHRLQSAYNDSDQLFAYAVQYQADYVVTTQEQNVWLDLPIVFQNSTYRVYQVTDESKR